MWTDEELIGLGQQTIEQFMWSDEELIGLGQWKKLPICLDREQQRQAGCVD